MNHPASNIPEDSVSAASQKGFIAFCETNLRYEKGYKAWLILGPYLLGALVLDGIVHAYAHTLATKIALWSGFLAYLILFPDIWRRILKRRISFKNANPDRAMNAQ